MGIVFHQCYSFIWFNNLLLSCSKNCLLIYFLSKGNKTCLWLYKKKPVELLFQRIDWQDTQQTKHQSILCFSPPSISATGVGQWRPEKRKLDQWTYTNAYSTRLMIECTTCSVVLVLSQVISGSVDGSHKWKDECLICYILNQNL